MIRHVHDFGDENYVLVMGAKVIHIRTIRMTLCGLDSAIMGQYAQGHEAELCARCTKKVGVDYAGRDGEGGPLAS